MYKNIIYILVMLYHTKYLLHKNDSHVNEQVILEISKYIFFRVKLMVFNATFKNISVISWWSILFSGGNLSTRR
jgi:hypothetical protein